MFKCDTLEKNRSLGNKLDGNKVHNYQLFEQQFSKRNIYDRFSVVTNRQPSKEVYMSVVPDYVTLTYSCIIFTDFVEQINPIIEAINFAGDSYWGDFSRFKFRARIDQFSTVTEVNTTDGRAVRSTFNIILNGYIIPDTINKQIANADMYYGTAQVIFNFETTTADLDTLSLASTTVTGGGTTSTTIFEGGNINVSIQGANAADLTYLGIMISKTAVSNTQTTAIFNTSFAQPPLNSSLPATSKVNFTFYVNGVFVPIDYVISFTDNLDGTCTLVINDVGIGYGLEATDEIVAVGKFS
jgi:hypothetical protein